MTPDPYADNEIMSPHSRGYFAFVRGEGVHWRPLDIAESGDKNADEQFAMGWWLGSRITNTCQQRAKELKG